ncbi:LPS-assembly lipoprotein [Pseudoduganella lurida]|uniref:LPS-assembly lipoprotein LptE n=1 Tax=Pseudoduganella lurida TaxID=1036180 RepID=A0A562QXL0_9BURK|nr:LPS assembly lipoprotein LptE [Pseudoduganella lurida]TWI61559.1 LPS-assembly lipoprotein [Pseudoduganella lurida]
MTLKTFARNAVLVAALAGSAVSLTACGFHLRGSGGNYTLPFASMYIGLPDSSPLAIELKRNIRVNGSTVVVNDAKSAAGVVEVLTDPEKTRSKSILSLNSAGRVSEYLLSYNILFRVTDGAGKELLGPTQIVLTRPITFDQTQLLAKEKEEAQLYRDMQADLVQQMMRRMAAIKPSRPDATPTSTVSPLTVPGVTAPGSVAPATGEGVSPVPAMPSAAPTEQSTEPTTRRQE